MNALREYLHQHRWFLLIVLLSLLLKIIILLQAGAVNPDAATYIAAADKYSQGLFAEGLRYHRMPFYSLLLAATHSLVPDWILAGRLLTIVPLLLTLWPLYALTQRLFNRHSALWATLLFAVLPTFNVTCASIKRDPLFLLFVITALLFLVICCQERQVKTMIGFALFAVLAILTRIEGVLLPVAALIGMAIICWLQSETRAFLLRIGAGLLLIPLILMIVLWGLEKLGLSTSSRLPEVLAWVKNVLNLKLFASYQHVMDKLKELQQTLPGAHLHNNLLEVTRHYAPLIYILGLVEIFIKAIFPTSLLALWALRWREKGQDKAECWLILLPLICFILLNILFSVTRNFTTVRYMWIPIVLSLPWVGYGISLWWQTYGPKRFVVMLVIAMIIVAPLSKTVAFAFKEQTTIFIQAGNWLQEYSQQKTIVPWYNSRRIALYADRIFEIKRIKNVKQLKSHLPRYKSANLFALYLPKNKGIDLQFEGFSLVKTFEENGKIIVIFVRDI